MINPAEISSRLAVIVSWTSEKVSFLIWHTASNRSEHGIAVSLRLPNFLQSVHQLHDCDAGLYHVAVFSSQVCTSMQMVAFWKMVYNVFFAVTIGEEGSMQ
jgi:hypothetical protein